MVVAERSFAALERLAAVSGETLSGVTRRRLEAALSEPAPERVTGRKGRPCQKGTRLATLSAVAAAPTTRWQRLTPDGRDCLDPRGLVP